MSQNLGNNTLSFLIHKDTGYDWKFDFYHRLYQKRILSSNILYSYRRVLSNIRKFLIFVNKVENIFCFDQLYLDELVEVFHKIG